MMNDEAEKSRSFEVDAPQIEDESRRRVFAMLGAVAAGVAVQAANVDEANAAESEVHPRRVLTGRDSAGKSVFKAFDVTPQVVEFQSRPGLRFYELYGTKGIPRVTGHEADAALTQRGGFPKPGDSWFRLVQFPPKPPEGTPPNPGAYAKYLKELEEKVPGVAEHFERDVPGMHTSNSVDYGIVIKGEMLLELDDGKTVHLKQGDCVVQNGTRHRWRNPLYEPCLMAFVLIGGVREG